jgi:hypothetical protein
MAERFLCWIQDEVLGKVLGLAYLLLLGLKGRFYSGVRESLIGCFFGSDFRIQKLLFKPSLLSSEFLPKLIVHMKFSSAKQ